LESGGISMGNAIGSTIFNILGIVGIIGLIRPLDFDRAFLRDFGRNAFVAYLAFFLLAIIDRSIDSVDAIILFCVLGASLYYGYRKRYVGAPSITPPSGTLFRDISIILVGGVVLGVGSYLLVFAAQSIAKDLGIPEIIIGLSLVAVGTSIPELATGIASTRKGIEEISIGNVLGANIYNVTLVLGCASLIGVIMHDMPLIAEDSTLFFDIPVMIGATVLLMVLGREGRVSRRTSIFFLIIYGVYLAITFSGIF
jgi:cation:H+ antiporter